VVEAETLVTIRFVRIINIDRVMDLTDKGWDEVKRDLESELKRRGLLRADVVADALIEEAKARASALVKEQLGRDVPELSEKIAKYIASLMIADMSAD